MYSEDIISTNADIGFMHDIEFVNAYQKCVSVDKGRWIPAGYSIKWRIHTLLWASKYALTLEGDFVDFGGGFGIFASSIYEYLKFENITKNYFLLDSFNGLDPETISEKEMTRIPHYARFGNWLDEVKDNFKNFDNMKIIPGFIPETLSLVDSDKICFASIDLNSTIPEKHALEFTWERLVKGGIIVFDDYGFPGHTEQKNSHDKFAKEKNALIYSCPTGQGILIK